MAEKLKRKTQREKSSKNSKKAFWKKAVDIAGVSILLLTLGVIYIGVADYFSVHFYKDTWINGNDCSYMTVRQVKGLIQENIDKYQLTMTTQEGESYTVTGPQFHLFYVDDRRVDELMEKQEPLKWIARIFQGRKYEVEANFDYLEDAVEPILKSLPFMRTENIVQPADAYMDETDAGYVIVPEIVGNALDEGKVLNLVHEAIRGGIGQISLTDSECYLKPAVYQNDVTLRERADMLNHLTRANLTYQVCGETFTVDAKLLKTWLITDEAGNYMIDPVQIKNFINGLADMRDSYGGKREFTTHSGKNITLATNKYGWLVNREESLKALKEAIAEGRQGEMELLYLRKGLGNGANDLGNVYVEISIDAQTMWCYKDGNVVVETPVVTGNMSIPGHATPKNGCWPIFRKTTEYTMKGPIQEDGEPEYTAFVHYWMPFNNGVGIHDLASRNSFGGNIYLTGGSHGCINTPYNAAKKIYETVSVGTPVIVY